MKKVLSVTLALFLTASVILTTGCMKEEDYYTKTDIDGFVDNLNNEITAKNNEATEKTESLKAIYEAKVALLEQADADAKAELKALTDAYNAKVKELEAADKANSDALAEHKTKYEADLALLQKADKDNEDAIKALNDAYTAKVKELEAADKANADALAAHKTAYEAKAIELNNKISANATAITTLKSELEDEIAKVKEDTEKEIGDINALITQLQNADTTNQNAIKALTDAYNAKVAELEAADKAHKDDLKELEDTLKALTDAYNAKIAELENKIAELETKHVHSFGELMDFCNNEELTCDKKIYYKVCSTCLEIQLIMGSEANHAYSEIYSYDMTDHWYACTKCDAVKGKASHTLDDVGTCTVCKNQITASAGIVYEISDDGTYAMAVDYTGSAPAVAIADEYEGVPVTKIAKNAFYGKAITSVFIPDSVTSIGSGAFSGCSGLTSITIPFVGEKKDRTSNTHFGYIFGAISYSHNEGYVPRSLKTVVITGGTRIGDYAFSDCSGLTSITIPDSVTSIGDSAFEYCSITSITIPNSVTSIGDTAFRDCSGLTSITIPDSVTSIGAYAFEYCSGLTSITIPDSVTSIGDYAFYNCSGLASITIPDSVTSIGNGAFYGCSSLAYTEYDNGKYLGNSTNPYVVLVKAKSTDITSCNINENTKIIYDSAFEGCTNLASITIPDSATSIGSEAFYGCSGLTSITIPDGVTSIGDTAFRDCSGLTSITIPDSVTSIGSNAFYGCSGLTSITIPDSVTSIGKSAFSGCSGLTSITIPFVGATKDGTSKTHFGYIFGASSASYSDDYVPTSLKTVVITGGTSIGSSAFFGCSGLTSITIPDSVTSIGSYAFSGCSGLTSITIPDSITRIGSYAFYGWSGLTSITIPDGVTSIGERAFYDCSGLTSITIPNSVTSIGDYAFSGCSSLSSVDFENTSGWCAGTTSISSVDLENTGTAATYLTSTYRNYYWNRT